MTPAAVGARVLATGWYGESKCGKYGVSNRPRGKRADEVSACHLRVRLPFAGAAHPVQQGQRHGARSRVIFFLPNTASGGAPTRLTPPRHRPAGRTARRSSSSVKVDKL